MNFSLKIIAATELAGHVVAKIDSCTAYFLLLLLSENSRPNNAASLAGRAILISVPYRGNPEIDRRVSIRTLM